MIKSQRQQYGDSLDVFIKRCKKLIVFDSIDIAARELSLELALVALIPDVEYPDYAVAASTTLLDCKLAYLQLFLGFQKIVSLFDLVLFNRIFIVDSQLIPRLLGSLMAVFKWFTGRHDIFTIFVFSGFYYILSINVG